MKTNEILSAIAMALTILTLFVLGTILGEDTKQEQIEHRALMMEKRECYSWQDIEIILFGEIQE